MKYLFMVMAIVSTAMFAVGLFVRLQTGDIPDWYRFEGVSMLVLWGVFAILDKLDRMS